MSTSQPGGSRQRDLFQRAKRTTITLPDDHPLVRLTDLLDWTEMEARAEKIRRSKLASAAGRPPHLRVLLGALVLMALRTKPYREVEEQIRYYSPARYLCALTETEWTPDFTTIHDFSVLLGEEGVPLINESVVDRAVELGLCDPRRVVADTTCQEAAIPHPNEMGLMGGFIRSLSVAARKAGQAVGEFVQQVGSTIKEAKEKVREYRLFAKTQEVKEKVLTEMVQVVEGITRKLGQVLEATGEGAKKLVGRARVARQGVAVAQGARRVAGQRGAGRTFARVSRTPCARQASRSQGFRALRARLRGPAAVLARGDRGKRAAGRGLPAFRRTAGPFPHPAPLRERHSAAMPASLASRRHLAPSARITRVSSAGVLPTGSIHCASHSAAFIAGSRMMRTNSAFRRRTISGGVFAGSMMAIHTAAS